MRTSCNYILAAAALALSSLFFCSQSSAAEKKKNVLMLVVDDWGARDLSCAGSTFYETPHVDELAANSTAFNQAYVAYPRCVPSRYSLFTGVHCARPQGNKQKASDDRKIDEDTYTIAEAFQDEGYNTFFIGKWHLSTETCSPTNKGFEINIGGGHAGAPSSYFAPFNQVRKNKHAVKRPIEGMDDAKPNEYLTDYMARKTVDYIQAHDGMQPFFAVCSFYAVHTPLEAKAELIEKYRQKRKQLGLTDDTFIAEEAGERKAQQNNPVYAAMIESVDEAVGSMIHALKEKELYENTVIVLISDHGGLSNRGNQRELATTNAPLKAGKGHLYEGGIRVPMFIRMPQQSQQIESEAIVASYDLFPTLTDICGLAVKENIQLDGRSLKPLLKNGANKAFNNRSIYWHKATERPKSTGDYLSSAIRKGDYKLIDFYQQGRVELYNIKQDPGETNNLIGEESGIGKELLEQLNQWKNQWKVNLPKEKGGKNKNKKNNEK